MLSPAIWLFRRDGGLFVVREESRQGRFGVLFRQTQRFRQPARAIQQAFGFRGHVGFLEVVDELRCLFARAFLHGLKDAWLWHTVQVVVRRGLPARRHQIKAGGHAGGKAALADARAVGVDPLVQGIDTEGYAMGQQVRALLLR